MTIDDDLDILFGYVDSLYWEKNLSQIDLILSQASSDMSLTLLVWFLTITIPHKEEFRYRNRILKIIKEAAPDRPQLWQNLE